MFSAVAEQMGLDYQTAIKVSCGFGGGMYLGSVCGAVTGGIMAIGLKYGGTGMEPSMRTSKLVGKLATRFEAQHQSINCPDLIGVNLRKVDPMTDPAVMKQLMENQTFSKCMGFVKDAATIAQALVTDPDAEGDPAKG